MPSAMARTASGWVRVPEASHTTEAVSVAAPVGSEGDAQDARAIAARTAPCLATAAMDRETSRSGAPVPVALS
jgi:hypothetical protein